MNKNKKIKTALTGILLLYTGMASATIYKWEDENHQIQYSQTPPPQGQVTTITPPPPPSHSIKSAQEQTDKLNKQIQQGEDKASFQKKEADLQEKNAKIRKTNCERATAHLQDMQSKPRVRLQQADGSLSDPLTSEQREADMQDAQKNIDLYCKEEK